MFILENIKKYKDKMNPDTTKVNILVVTTEFFYINTYLPPYHWGNSIWIYCFAIAV